MNFLIPFRMEFWSIFRSNLASKSHQNRPKIDAIMHSIFESIFWSIFDRFLLLSWVLRTQFGPSGLVFSWFLRIFASVDFCSHFGSNLAPFWLPKSTKIFQNVDCERYQKINRFLHRFLIDFGTILGPSWAPRRRSNRAKRHPRRARKAPTTALERLWAPKIDFDWFSIDFLLIFCGYFARFLIDFSLIFNCFLDCSRSFILDR